MSEKPRRYTALTNLPPLTEKQKAELPDSEIDTSDIPPLSEGFWKMRCAGAKVRLLRPPKSARRE